MDTQTQIERMLKENTGQHMCDSGMGNGRNWQRNQEKNFQSLPQVTFEKDYGFTVSVYHWLNENLEQDEFCLDFNSTFTDLKHWDGAEDLYGVNKSGEAWIKDRFELVGERINTCNGDSDLSQVLLYQRLKSFNNDEMYILLQVHGGADVRGGYTDAKLFKISDNSQFESSGGYVETQPTISGEAYNKKTKETVTFDYRGYDGFTIVETNEDLLESDFFDKYEIINENLGVM